MKSIYYIQFPTNRITVIATSVALAIECGHFSPNKSPDDGCKLATIENVEKPLCDVYRLANSQFF